MFYTNQKLEEIAARQEKILANILAVLDMTFEHQRVAALRSMNKRPQQQKVWLDKQDVMEMLHVSRKTLYNLRKDGHIKDHPIRGKIYFSAENVNELLHSRKK